MKTKSRVLTFLLVAGTCACRPATVSRSDDFIERTVLSETPLDLKLSFIESSPFAGRIQYKVTQRKTNAGKAESTFFDYNDVVVAFPSLTAEQFDFLKSTYGDGRSHVRFQAGQAYEIADFLAPAIQALNKMQWFSLDGQDATNCWSTAYEVANYAEDHYEVFVSSPIEMMATLEDPHYATLLAAGEALKPGDIAIDYWTNDNFISPNIGHAVIYIDEKLYFEKFGLGNTPFGIAANGYLPAGNKLANGHDQFRFRRGAPRPGSEQFAGINNRFRPVVGAPIPTTTYQLSYDELGRAHLPGSGVLSKSTFSTQGRTAYEMQFVVPPAEPANEPTFQNLRSQHPSCLVLAFSGIQTLTRAFKVSAATKLDCDIQRYTQGGEHTYGVEGICVGNGGAAISEAALKAAAPELSGFTYQRTDAGAFTYQLQSDCYLDAGH